MQKKNKDIIGRIMNEYLSTIEEVYALAAAKLWYLSSITKPFDRSS